MDFMSAMAKYPPPEVCGEPRYVQETFGPMQGPPDIFMQIWDLDGIGWAQADPPPRWHDHWAQTTGFAVATKFQRCPCGATWTARDGWVPMSEPRIQPGTDKQPSRWNRFRGWLGVPPS